MIRRWVAGAVVAVLLLAHAATPASAAVIPFDPTECHVAASGTAEPRESWHLKRLQMDRVWHLATGRGVTVAVIDTGTATSGSMYLQEAADKRFTAYDLLDGVTSTSGQETEFDCLHGTRVTALLAAGRGPDGRPVDARVEFSGIAPDARVLTYRTLMESESDGDDEPQPLYPTTEAVIDAVQRGAQVINLSQVVPGNVDGIEDFQAAIAYAINEGVVVVAAAGNTGQLGGSRAYPASFDGVISVGASNRHDAGAEVSQFGAKVDLGAPGQDLISLDPSRYDTVRAMESQVYSPPISGTSFAAPIVSGVVALMIEHQQRQGLPPLTPFEVKQRLVETVDPPAAATPDPRLGAGIVNPLRALSGDAPQLAPNEEADNRIPPNSYPPPTQIDQTPAAVGLVMGVGAILLTLLGLVAAIVIPAARRNSRRGA